MARVKEHLLHCLIGRQALLHGELDVGRLLLQPLGPAGTLTTSPRSISVDIPDGLVSPVGDDKMAVPLSDSRSLRAGLRLFSEVRPSTAVVSKRHSFGGDTVQCDSHSDAPSWLF